MSTFVCGVYIYNRKCRYILSLYSDLILLVCFACTDFTGMGDTLERTEQCVGYLLYINMLSGLSGGWDAGYRASGV